MADMKYQSTKTRAEVLAEFIKQQGVRTFVEVGCKDGKTTGALLEAVRYLNVIAIDPWAPMPQQKDVEGGETYEDWDFAAIEAKFKERLGTHAHRCKMLRMTSLAAAEQLAGQGFGCVFIDAAHDYDSVVADIRAWYPLVKDGGFLMGHDYQHKFPTVIRAVASCFPLLRVGILPDSVWMVMKSPDLDAQGIPLVPDVREEAANDARAAR